jgi:WD40 repeat protein
MLWRWLLLMVLAPLPPLLVTGGSFVLETRDELAWRRRTSLEGYLREGAGAYRELAEWELERQQRAAGLVARLRDATSKKTNLYAASWSEDGTQILTADGGALLRWDAKTGALLEALPRNGQPGGGFMEGAFLEPGKRAAGVESSGREKELFVYGAGGEIVRHVFRSEGIEKIRGRGGRLAWVRNLESGIVLDLAAGKNFDLAHEQATQIGFTAGGDVVTAARGEMKFWRDGQLLKTVTAERMGHPEALSENSDLLFTEEVTGIDVWDTAAGVLRFTLPHNVEAKAACSAGDTIVTGTEDGKVHIWRTTTGEKIREFLAHPVSIAEVYCGPGQVITVSHERSNGRLWDLAGRAQSPMREPMPAAGHGALVEWGADVDLPARFPGLADFLYGEPWLFPAGILAGVGWLLLARHLLFGAKRKVRR